MIQDFLASGTKAKIIVTQADQLGAEFIDRELDASCIHDLREQVDICGEDGAYHTFAYAGGLFRKPVDFSSSGTRKVSYNTQLGNGISNTFEYGQAVIKA